MASDSRRPHKWYNVICTYDELFFHVLIVNMRVRVCFQIFVCCCPIDYHITVFVLVAILTVLRSF